MLFLFDCLRNISSFPRTQDLTSTVVKHISYLIFLYFIRKLYRTFGGNVNHPAPWRTPLRLSTRRW